MTKAPPKSHLQPVASSAFSHAGYDPTTRKLSVRFNSGKTWEYDDVTLERGEAFLGSASKGRYFADQIKPNHIGREVIG